MSKQSQKKAKFHSYEVAMLLLVALLLIPAFTSAQPGGSPPLGNVDATFNSVSIDDGVSPLNKLVIDDAGTLNSPSGNVTVRDSQGFSIFQDNGTTEVLRVDSTGVLSTPTNAYGGKLNLWDLNGILFNSYLNIDSSGTLSNPDPVMNGGNVAISDSLDVTGNVTGTDANFNRFVDRNSPSYYVDPASTSYLNSVYGGNSIFYRFYDRNNTGYYLDPASTSYLNSVYGGNSYFSTYYDKDNTGYYVNPASTSNMYRGEFATPGDATPSAGTGALEIANSLRIDGNEVVTNSGTPLHLQYDNGGFLYVDNGTLTVDPGNRVGINDGTPSYSLDVNGTLRTTGNIYTNSYGDIYTGSYGDLRLGYAGDVRLSTYGDVFAGSSGRVGRFYTVDGPYNYPRTAGGNPWPACYGEGWWGATPNGFCTLYAYCSSGDYAVAAMPGSVSGMPTNPSWHYTAGGVSGSTAYVTFTTSNKANTPSWIRGRAVCFSPDGP